MKFCSSVQGAPLAPSNLPGATFPSLHQSLMQPSCGARRSTSVLPYPPVGCGTVDLREREELLARTTPGAPGREK